LRGNVWVGVGLKVVLGMLAGVWAGAAGAQTLATGDARTVTEPVFPAVCTTLVSQMTMVSGGPASETDFDTARIQTALTGCASGQAVELSAAGANDVFLIQPINIPTGVSLIVDGGVTVFASRNPADYQISGAETCGTYGASGNGCSNLIKFGNNSTNANSGIYGYGVIDARGNATLLKNGVDSGVTWWANADQATTAGESQDNFVIMSVTKSTNFTLYKITLRNSPMFHVVWSGTGFTAWDVKIATPFATHNTDGIDPKGTNITITNSSISDGDDDVAVSASSASANITISNSTTYSGHGISVGSYTQGGLNNMLVNNVNMAGTASDTNATGIRLKSSEDRGGLVQNVTYENMCVKDIHHIVEFTPFYNSNTGTEIPTFQNVVMQNLHFLTPTTNQYPYLVQMEGHDASHISTITMNNVVFDSLLAANVTPTSQYDAFTLAGNVYPAFLQSLPGTGVTYTGTATATAGAGVSACPLTVFPYLVGELYLTSPTASNLQTATISQGSSVTLNAMVEPAMSQVTFSGTAGSYTGAAAVAQPVSFYEGSNVVGTASVGANGTLASVTLSGLSAGTHTYTAKYPGDANYNALGFGSVTVTVTGASTASTTVLTTPATSTYGTAVTLSAAVSGSGGTPTGSVAFYDGTTLLGSSPLSAGAGSLSVTLAGGSHSLTAVYSGDTTFVTSTSTVKALAVATASTMTGLTSLPTTVTAGQTAALTATVTGVSGQATPTGTVSFTDGVTSLGNASLNGAGVAMLTATLSTPGSRTITASYGGDGNYAVSSGNTMVMVVSGTTSTALTAPATAVFGTGVSLSAKITATGGTPTGTISFYDGTTLLGTAPVASNAASLTGVTLAGGMHSLTAVYSGDSVFPASTSTASMFTVTTAATTTGLSAAPATVVAFSALNLTATVTGVSGQVTPSGTVTFSVGATVLGTGQLAGGVATLATSLSTTGSQTITAAYGGDTNYGVSSGTAPVVATVAPTVTTLALSSPTVFNGGTVTLTATVTPATTGTVSFVSGGTVLGTGTVNALGVATFVYTAPAGVVGAMAVTASYAATGPFAASVSAAAQLTVSAAFVASESTGAVTIAAGSSGMVNLVLTPGAGFTGTVALACSSPVTYVTCSVSSANVTLNGSSATTVTGTIQVAATTSSLATPRTGLYLAMLGPLGLAGLLFGSRRRKMLRRLALLLMLAGAMGAVSGCGGAAPASGGSKNNVPTGSQIVTFTATGGGSTQTLQVVVTI
jgi:polygalacturonase